MFGYYYSQCDACASVVSTVALTSPLGGHPFLWSSKVTWVRPKRAADSSGMTGLVFLGSGALSSCGGRPVQEVTHRLASPRAGVCPAVEQVSSLFPVKGRHGNGERQRKVDGSQDLCDKMETHCSRCSACVLIHFCVV